MNSNCRGSRRDGVALIAVLGFIFMLCAALAIMAQSSVQRSFTVNKLIDRVRAVAYAEAGASEAYAMIDTDWSCRTNAALFPVTAFAEGSFDVTVTTPTNKVAVIHSLGVCNGTEATVVLDIKNYGVGTGGEVWDESAFDYGMLCGGTFTFRGCGNISSTGGVTLIHANDVLDIRGNAQANVDISSSVEISIGNNKTVDGDVTAPILDYNPSKVTITGTASEGPVPFVSIPDIDLTPYYNWANDNGEVHNGFSFSGASYTPVGGILWVNGDVAVSSHAVINGSIIATGDIHMSGQCDVVPTISAFGLASRDGDINITSSGDISGLIYAKIGDYDHTANGRVSGQIIVGGNISKGGNSDVFLFSRNVPTPPGDDPGSSGDIVGLSAWQK